jgi:hypothetical protein
LEVVAGTSQPSRAAAYESTDYEYHYTHRQLDLGSSEMGESIREELERKAREKREAKASQYAAKHDGALPPESRDPFSGGLHYVSATSVLGGTPDSAFSKVKEVVNARFPNVIFEIVSLQTHLTNIGPGAGWTVTALLREVPTETD